MSHFKIFKYAIDVLKYNLYFKTISYHQFTLELQIIFISWCVPISISVTTRSPGKMKRKKICWFLFDEIYFTQNCKLNRVLSFLLFKFIFNDFLVKYVKATRCIQIMISYNTSLVVRPTVPVKCASQPNRYDILFGKKSSLPSSTSIAASSAHRHTHWSVHCIWWIHWWIPSSEAVK